MDDREEKLEKITLELSTETDTFIDFIYQYIKALKED